ncbi:MAG: hypothetical protein AMXMBFR23_20700 [Chloroflexota bacterium]
MRAIAQRLPFHYGWFLMGAGVLCNTVSNFATFWAVSMWVPAIADDFEVARTPVVTAFIGGQAVSALVAPFIGRYIDRNGARRPLLVGSVVFPGALLLTSMAQGLLLLYMGWIVVGLVRGLTQPIPFNWLMTRWFDGRLRQSALGVLTVGFSLGGATFLPVLAEVQRSTSWSFTMQVTAVIVFVLQGVTALFLVRNRPADIGMVANVGASDRGLAQVPAEQAWGFTAAAAIRTPAFWLLGFALMLFFMGQGSVTNLGLDFFQSREVQAGAAVFAAASWVRTIARIPLGATLSRYRTPYPLGVIVAISQGIAVAALLLSTDLVGISIFVALWGIGGAFGPMLEPLFIPRVFGVRHFGAVSGSVALVAFVGQLIGSIGGAFLFDVTGSYSIPYWLYTGGFGVAALLFLAVRWAEARPGHIAKAEAMGRPPSG